MKSFNAVLGLVAAVASLCPTAVWACSSCGCGNPALTSFTTAPPLANRVRLATALRAWSEDEAGTTLRELRFDLLASWAPTDRVTVWAAWPLQLRERTQPTLARERAFAPGDAEVGARWALLVDERMRPRWVVSLLGGLRAPTAPTVADARGVPLDVDTQTGAGGFAGLVGVGYSGFFTERFSMHAELVAEAPFAVRSGASMPWVARVMVAGQLQPAAWLGLRAGAELRGERAALHSAATEASHDGLMLFFAPDVLVRLATDFTLLAGARVPLFDTRAGVRAGPMAVASVVVDL